MANSISEILKNQDVATLFRIFRENNYEVRCVGGCVRDAILNLDVSDVDFATNATPEIVQKILEKYGISYYNSGLKHGTVTAVFNKTSYEITTLRLDVNCDGRHAEVAFSNNWQDDASRRDFTFNALYLDEFGKIYDYFAGVNDLKNGVLKFIGNAEARICEDYLRILRALRFYNRYCSVPLDNSTKQILKKLGPKITNLSGERVQSEIIKLLNDLKSVAMLDLFNELDLAQYVFYTHTLKIPEILRKINIVSILKNPWHKLGLIMRYNNISAKLIKEKWHIANQDYKLLNIINSIRIDKSLTWKHKKWAFLYFDIKEVLLICATIEDVITEDELFKTLSTFPKAPVFPICAQDLIKIGFSGKQIGDELKRLRDIWLENNCEMQ